MAGNEEELPVGKLEEEAKRRKERLRQLRQKLQGEIPVEQDAKSKNLDGPLPKPVFRSYNPQDAQFQEAAQPKAAPVNIEEHIADTLEQGHVKTLLDDVELSNLAPRKPDWDLKRDVSKKLEKLERRTQRAIAELILERLQNTQDLSAAVSIPPK